MEWCDFAVKQLNNVVYNIWKYAEVMVKKKILYVLGWPVCTTATYELRGGRAEWHFTLVSTYLMIFLMFTATSVNPSLLSLPFASKSLGGAWGAQHVTHGQTSDMPLFFFWLSSKLQQAFRKLLIFLLR